VDVLFLWHHHQPDYRSPREGRALLPWVRLHATKDYLDMALHLERHPRVRATFNFVPSLLDQLEEAAGGTPDALFDLIGRPVESLSPVEQTEVLARCSLAPRHAFERFKRYRALVQRLAASGGGEVAPTCSRSRSGSCSRGSIRSTTASPKPSARWPGPGRRRCACATISWHSHGASRVP
jgi:alpha-amylase/alpha-mannosidase (GH57 family)